MADADVQPRGEVAGLHHLTAIGGEPQRSLDFYAGLLGLRLVKKTVNFDDPSAYHLYYGDGAGEPGSILTFFYWPGTRSGRVGAGQPTRISLAAPASSLPYWEERLRAHGVPAQPVRRFGEDTLALTDPDGIPVEIVGAAGDTRRGWSGSGVPAEHGLRGLFTVELTVREIGPTERLLTEHMDFTVVRREGGRTRFQAGPGGPGRCLDVIADASAAPGLGAAGTIHHVAFRVADDGAQLRMRRRLAEAGFGVSEVRDRTYFHSIYYREPGGVLFEIATDPPGFATDEPAGSLGSALMLPRQFERLRPQIEASLPPLRAARAQP